MRPHLIKSSSEAFFCIKTIHEKRKAVYPLENGIALATVFPKNFVPAFYLRHERNYLFLWKQLLGLEAFYLSEEDTYLLNQIFAAELLKERLGSGSLSPDTLTLIRLFLSQLPHYDQLLKKHPELPLLYEMIWHNRSVLLDWN